MYWTHTFEDLRRITDIRVQFEIVKAMSYTEGLLFTASKIFGAKDTAPVEDLNSVGDMIQFASFLNGG